jgi:hypothetical protein
MNPFLIKKKKKNKKFPAIITMLPPLPHTGNHRHFRHSFTSKFNLSHSDSTL